MVSQIIQKCMAYEKVFHRLNILVRKGWMVFSIFGMKCKI
jgi:hypothetical protein